MYLLKITLSVALLSLALACSDSAASDRANSAASNASSLSAPPAAVPVDALAMGRNLYNQNCAVCHKEDGRGGTMTIEGKSIDADDLTSEKIKKFSDEKIMGYIVNGVEDEGMPAFKDKLSEAQIREIVSYVRQGIQNMPAEPAKPTR